MTNSYTSTYGQEYSPDNLYSYGQKGFSEPVVARPTPPAGSPATQGLTSLIGNSGEGIANRNAYDSLSDPYKFILDKKWGLWKNSDQDTGQKGVADTLEDINKIVVYKGGKPVSNWSQVPGALDPIIAKRNKKGGLGSVLGMVAPIALSFLAPGIGSALGGALSISATAGSALAGAGLGAIGGGITGGAKGALLGGLMGGAGGAFQGAGGLSGLNNSLGYASEAANFVGPVRGPLSGLVSGASKLGSGGSSIFNLSNASKLVSGLQDLTGGQQQGSQGYSAEQQAQLAALINQYQNQGNGNKSIFLRAAGMATGGIVRGPGDGMSDGVPAVIGGERPAALSDGEHVVPALQVAMLGRGSGKAGSSKIQQLVDQEISKMYGQKADPRALQKMAMRKKGK